MERMTRWVRQSGMMSPRHIHGIVVAGVLCAAVAGCGTVKATTAASGQAAVSAAASASSSAAGCASVSQATSVTIHRSTAVIQPAHVGSFTMTQRKPALVRALFSDFCKLIAHPYRGNHPMDCPASLGISYSGTFFDGQRKLATFDYAASGCQNVRVGEAGKSTFTLVFGAAATAAPHLENDMAAVLGQSKSAVFGAGQKVNPGGVMLKASPAS